MNSIASKLARLAGQVCKYARLCGYMKYNPPEGITGILTKTQEKHYAAITEPKEIHFLLNDIAEYHGNPSVSYALRIMPYLFVRSRELHNAEWIEFDFQTALWIIPSERMKMRRAHIVPLAKQVILLLESLKNITGGGKYLFPSPFSASRCITDVALLNALRRLGYSKE
jgi:integrase